MSQPLVTVVTPVYNTEAYIEECIESVLAQTYENWEYVIVDNCSTDASAEIAARFAERDPRIRVHTNETFLKQMENWNHALRLVGPESVYCKVLHADDWLFPRCLEQMVACAEAHPSAGVVASYRLDGDRVDLDGLPYPSPITPGREIGRLYLLPYIYLLGAPTSLLLRSEIVRARDPFYEVDNLHADVHAVLEVLKDWDYGFVHEVLTYTRRHNESSSSKVARFATRRLSRLSAFYRHGPYYLDPGEVERAQRLELSGHYRFLARQVLELRDRAFWKFQREELERMGLPFSYGRLAFALFLEVLDLRGSAKLVLHGIRERRSGKQSQPGAQVMKEIRKT